MTSDCVNIYVAVALFFLGTGYLVVRYLHFEQYIKNAKEDKAKVPEERPFTEFAKKTDKLVANEEDKAKAAESVSKEVARLFDQIVASNAAIDAKATTILGFVGGGASLYTLAIESKATDHPTTTPLLVLAVVFFVVSLIACLVCLASRFTGGLPELHTQFADEANVLYNEPIVTNARVAAFLSFLHQDRLSMTRPANVRKARWIDLAHAAFFVGVIAFIANYAVNQSSMHTSQQCSVKTTGNTVQLNCKEVET